MRFYLEDSYNFKIENFILVKSPLIRLYRIIIDQILSKDAKNAKPALLLFMENVVGRFEPLRAGREGFKESEAACFDVLL